MKNKKEKLAPWKNTIRRIIYGTDTPGGKIFDIALLIVIFLSIIFVMLESVSTLKPEVHRFLFDAEWVITGLFTLEYIARIICVRNPKRYIFSFYGIIDLISTIPLYLALFIPVGGALLTVRALRLLRIFRILKVNRYIGEGNRLKKALNNSKEKIFIFLFTVVIISLIAGTLMYLIEGEKNEAFTSIPRSLYWCIVTLTTVGFGDIYPVTALGQGIASVIMIMGYGIIAVPTGIVTAEFTRGQRFTPPSGEEEAKKQKLFCPNCGKNNHDPIASYCSDCGHQLKPIKE